MIRIRPLPGISITAEMPSIDGLPRMDVAAFVGFASRGPINVPVVVEDIARFEDIFGPAPRLAWDADNGIWQRAHLAAAVRDFFTHGGRRCWVVRVAASGKDRGAAVSNRFPIPGLLYAGAGQLVPAVARARSAGSWSDNLRVGATLLVDEVVSERTNIAHAEWLSLKLSPLRGGELHQGDLVQLDFAENGGGQADKTVAYLSVEGVQPAAQPDGRTGQWQMVEGPVYWLSEANVPHPLEGTVRVEPSDGPVNSVLATLERPEVEQNTRNLGLYYTGNVDLKPKRGSWLTFTPGGKDDRIWLLVDDMAYLESRYRHAWREGAVGPIGKLVRARRVTMALAVRDDTTQTAFTLLDLGFSPLHPRFWGYLPNDDELYRGTHGYRTEVDGIPGQALLGDVESPRFPLAGTAKEDTAGVFIPLGLSITPVAWGEMVDQEKNPLSRDGLVPEGDRYPPAAFLTCEHWAEFFQSIFLDDGLRRSQGEALLAEAFDRQFVQVEQVNGRVKPSTPVTGLHSIFALEDISMLALPDAVHCGWRLVQPKPQPRLTESATEIAPETCPGHELFQPQIPNLDPEPIDYIDQDEGWVWIAGTAYRLTNDSDIADGLVPGDIVVVELTTLEGRTVVVVELKHHEVVGTLETISDSGEEVVVAGDTYRLYDSVRANKDHIKHRVALRRRRLDDGTTVVVSIKLADDPACLLLQLPTTTRPSDDRRWEMLPARECECKLNNLLDIHKGAIRLAAARADMMAILGMPEHFLSADVLAYRSLLRSWLDSERRGTASYAALYHPWLIRRDITGQLRSHGPEGAVSGIIAARSLARGAWVPPANEQIRDALALRPAIGDEDHSALYNAQINLIRANPDGFVLWGADTLSENSDLMALNVRRLLILLRRLALREGQTYTFEPNSPDFRGLLASSFERHLANLYSRGAFAGNHPSQAYRVVIDETINTHRSVERGQLIVELRVAPSQPLIFIAVRLLQTDAGTLDVQEG